MTHKENVESLALSEDQYVLADVSKETERIIKLSSGLVHKIEKPVTLIMRKGGKTHRVIDADGLVHCYAAPETGEPVILWKTDATQKVQF